MNLKLNYCSFQSARYAVMNWHYSKCMPAGKLVKIGVWENDIFKGAVIFGRGANNNLPKSLGMKVTECCELVRVALDKHETETTRIVAIALKLLKKSNPGLKIVFSYADQTNQGHKGIIYRAGNWKYHGIRKHKGYFLNTRTGEYEHQRSLNSKYHRVVNYPDYYREMPKEMFFEKHFFTYDLRK